MGRVPPSNQLQWSEIRDFTPGLWETGGFGLEPAQGAQYLADAYPQPGGGLRAFFKPSTFSVLATVGAGERVVGFFGYTANHRTLPTTGVDYYLVTMKTADLKPRLYRWDTTDVTQTDFTLIHTFAAASADEIHTADMTAYVLSSLAVKIVVRLGYVGADAGLWSAPQADVTGVQAFAKIATTTGGPIAVHQNRLLEGRGSVVWFTNPGDETFGASNFVNIEPQRQQATVRFMIPNAPGDLVVAKEGAAWSAIQGDLTNPIVRTMSDAHTPGQRSQSPADTGQGIAFIEPDSGIYLTYGGSTFQRIDQDLNPPQPAPGDQPAITMGQVVFFRRWLFLPRGYVFDVLTKAWFRLSTYIFDPNYIQFLDKNAGVYGVHTSNRKISKLDVEEATGTRANSWVWQSAPMRSSDGRDVQIREVQVVAIGNNSSSSISVTVNGTTVTKAIAGNYNHVSFLFRQAAPVLDVTIEADSNNTGQEAPSIELVRVGYQSLHLRG